MTTLGREAEEQLMQIMQTDKLELVSHLGGDMANVKTLDEQF